MRNTQLDIFNPLEIKQTSIGGLLYEPNYITQDAENELIEKIDQQEWINDLKRRVQHYGYRYNYKARRIDYSMRIGNLPNWCEHLAERLLLDGFFNQMPDQVIVNEYMPGQGISPHIDCEPCFEDTIVSLSLGSATTMNFENAIEKVKVPIVLARRSIVVLKGESRYNWKHSIPVRKSDKINGKVVKRKRRISLTFRKVII